MPVKTSTGLRNYIMDSGSMKTAMTGCLLKVYSGAVPATANASATGNTLLCTYYKDGVSPDGLNWEASAVNGVLAKSTSETWEGTAGASGTASFFRLVEASDDDDASTTFKRIQGVVGVVGADLNLSSVSISSGAPQSIDSFSLVLPTY